MTYVASSTYVPVAHEVDTTVSHGLTSSPQGERRAQPPMLKRPGDGLDVETLDDVTGADVLVVGERHAALLAGRHLAHLVLEALQRRERAFVDDDFCADQAHLGAALDLAFGNAATRDLADLGDVEHLQDLGIAEEDLAHRRRQQAGH